MKRYIFIILLALSFSAKAQPNINHYKYIIVPEKYSFLKQPNQYNLNGVTKALFEGMGFTVYYDNADLPTEIAGDRCKALTADVLEKNSMFVTNLTVVLKDCKGTVVLKSKEGKSREKEYKTSFNLALQDAFSSLNDFRYTAGSTPETSIPAPATTTTAAAPAQEVKTEAVPAPVSQPATTGTKLTEAVLYAQPINNGYQLVDATPKIVMTLLKTSVEDFFIASNGGIAGVVLKKNGSWFFEYYKNNVLVSDKLPIKF
ncbi:hypothetical protein [Pedobacter miscanthi]|uniref:Beta-lactamase-inhibitor-like PepSY-like domain-containing protein n=1 Tax=Pedobacter miscanthi TaxID=2259170 RepID=A0A366LDC9_9SPHI|nr:hypothetical protein [Pedobacter miscanthi]RBQ11888.1 hypothetical protein DRW42_01035 [Pedobacter miscanthi]